MPEPATQPRPASRDEQRTRIRAAAVTLRVSRTVQIETEIDVVSWFGGLNEAQRSDYHSADLVAEGYDYCDDFYRPVMFLMARSEPEIVEGLLCDDEAISRVDQEETTDRVTYRHGAATDRVAAAWAQEDFDALVERHPWMRPDEDTTAEVVLAQARTPGPFDRPLF